MSNIEDNPPTAKDGLLILGILLAFGAVAYFVEEERTDRKRQPVPADTIRVTASADRETIIIIKPE